MNSENIGSYLNGTYLSFLGWPCLVKVAVHDSKNTHRPGDSILEVFGITSVLARAHPETQVFGGY